MLRPDHPAAAHPKILDHEAAIVEVVPRRKRVAIVGFAESSRNLAPYDDPSWEIWGLNQLDHHIPRADRWFEIHQRQVFLADTVRDVDYLATLRGFQIPVYMQEHHADIPNSVRFPIERVLQFGEIDYFQSSIALMFALAMVEGFEEIGVWGVDLVVGSEYDYQKPNLEFWLGLALGKGLRVSLPAQTALLKQSYRYGYDHPPSKGPLTLQHFDTRIAKLQEEHGRLLTQINACEGALMEAQNWRFALELALKGTTFPGSFTATS